MIIKMISKLFFSNYSPKISFKILIISGEVEMLSTLPGIGPKTAKRLIVELKDKFTISNPNDIPIDTFSNIHKDAYSALIQLGYHNRDIQRAIQKITLDANDIQTQDLIKLCLKDLQ